MLYAKHNNSDSLDMSRLRFSFLFSHSVCVSVSFFIPFVLFVLFFPSTYHFIFFVCIGSLLLLLFVLLNVEIYSLYYSHSITIRSQPWSLLLCRYYRMMVHALQIVFYPKKKKLKLEAFLLFSHSMKVSGCWTHNQPMYTCRTQRHWVGWITMNRRCWITFWISSLWSLPVNGRAFDLRSLTLFYRWWYRCVKSIFLFSNLIRFSYGVKQFERISKSSVSVSLPLICVRNFVYLFWFWISFLKFFVCEIEVIL